MLVVVVLLATVLLRVAIVTAVVYLLLPQGPLSVSGLSVVAFCAPAREVGGDYYDFFQLGKRRVGMLVGGAPSPHAAQQWPSE